MYIIPAEGPLSIWDPLNDFAILAHWRCRCVSSLLAAAGRMEGGTRGDRSLDVDASGSGGEEGSASVGVDSDLSYRRLIRDQMAELEELKRAARDASPSR